MSKSSAGAVGTVQRKAAEIEGMDSGDYLVGDAINDGSAQRERHEPPSTRRCLGSWSKSRRELCSREQPSPLDSDILDLSLFRFGTNELNADHGDSFGPIAWPDSKKPAR